MIKVMLCGLFLLLGIILAVPRVALAETMNCKPLPVQRTVTVDGENINSNEHRMEVKQGDYIRVELIAAGGTGYQWQLKNEDLQMTEVSDKISEPVKVELGRTGGPIKTVFIMKVKENARGEEKLIFSLVRPWEKQKNEAKVFKLTVQVQ